MSFENPQNFGYVNYTPKQLETIAKTLNAQVQQTKQSGEAEKQNS